jgi:hypothetical protein
VLNGLAGMSLCVFMCLYINMCVYVCIYIYIIINMDLSLWARKCSENLVRISCNHFAVTADKWPCGLDGLAGLSLCVCVCVYIYICVCVYTYKK